jgi:hypothetical protein
MADETKGERLNRELEELLQGLRVLLPGVGVLFGFLLTVPFSQRFTQITRSQEVVYVVALACAALATTFLSAPGAFHRVLFRDRDKEWLVIRSNILAIIGTVFLATAITAGLYLAVEMAFRSAVAAAVAGGVGALIAILWYVIPLVRRASN